MKVLNINKDNPKMAANPATQIFYSLRHFPELRQSMNGVELACKQSNTHVLTNQYRIGSAYGTRSKSPAQQKIGRHNSDKINKLQIKMNSLRHSSLHEFTTLRDVRDQIRLNKMNNHRPSTTSTISRSSSTTACRQAETPTTIRPPPGIVHAPTMSPALEHGRSALGSALTKLEISGFPGYYDEFGKYSIDGEGFLAVLGISRRIPRQYSNDELKVIILHTIGIEFSDDEIQHLREQILFSELSCW